MERENYYLFVIDTEQYAGNFERQMAAYCTGVVGECEVGDTEAYVFSQECPEFVEQMENIIAHVPDEHECHRPVSIYATPGWWNDGLGSHYLDSEWGKRYTAYKYKEEAKKRKIKRGIKKHPAYMSVAIYFYDEKPPKSIINLIKQRAIMFPEYWRKDNKPWHEEIKITGFRLLHEVVTTKQVWGEKI